MPFTFLPAGGEAGALIAPSGTRIPMQQATAPFGWTSDISAGMGDCSMRINSGTGGAIGGSTGWSGWNFGGTFNVNSFTLSVGQLPPHNHTDTGHTHTTNPHSHVPSDNGSFFTNFNGGLQLGGSSVPVNTPSSTNSVTVVVNTGTANIQNTGSGNSIQPSYTTPQVKFADHIMAVKS